MVRGGWGGGRRVLTEPGDFERMRLLPKFRFLRFLSRCLCCAETMGWRREEEAEWEPVSGELLRAGPHTKGLAKLHAWGLSLRSARALWGATLCFYLCFDFFSSPHFFRSLLCSFYFCTFLSFRLVSAFVLFSALAKKHFNLQMRNKFQTKAQSFPLQINF